MSCIMNAGASLLETWVIAPDLRSIANPSPKTCPPLYLAGLGSAMYVALHLGPYIIVALWSLWPGSGGRPCSVRVQSPWLRASLKWLFANIGMCLHIHRFVYVGLLGGLYEVCVCARGAGFVGTTPETWEKLWVK